MFCPLSNLTFLWSKNQCTIFFMKPLMCLFMNLFRSQRMTLITISMGLLNTSNTMRNMSTLRSTMLSAVQAFRQRSLIDNLGLSSLTNLFIMCYYSVGYSPPVLRIILNASSMRTSQAAGSESNTATASLNFSMLCQYNGASDLLPFAIMLV